MKKIIFVKYSILLFSTFLYASETISLPNLFSDNMVLQRNSEVLIWGSTIPSSQVTIKTPWTVKNSISDKNGYFIITLKTPYFKEPFKIDICNPKECVVLENVILGEVWLASGQSNMEMPLKGWLPNDPINNSENEIQNAVKYPIRFFTVKHSLNTQPQNNLSGKWEMSTPENATNFSATAFFFAREISKKIDVPVGIIHSSWGGTPVQSWISSQGLKTTGLFDEFLDKFSQFEKNIENFEKWIKKLDAFPSPFKTIPKEWTKKALNYWREIEFNDSKYREEIIDASKWNTIKLPGDYVPNFNNDPTSDFDGIVWLRKSFIVDDPSQEYILKLGPVDDMEYTFINGIQIGSTIGPDSFLAKSYKIPKNILKKGVNHIAIRTIDTGGVSSMRSPIVLTSDVYTISLVGEWKALKTAELYQDVFYNLDESDPYFKERPTINKLTSWTPTALFNSMINPLIKYKIKGVIWYQGEANVDSHYSYENIFKAMIRDWRTKWGYDFPFYYAQIAPFDYGNNLSPYLRNAQLKVSYLEDISMAVTLDIGNPNNIHPSNKQAVGKRLAELAFVNTYKISNKYKETKPISVKRKNNMLEIYFDCINEGLIYKNEKNHEIEISSDNHNFYPAEVDINGCKVILSSNKVKNPIYVRHAWSDVASGALFNSSNIPISTFLLEVGFNKN